MNIPQATNPPLASMGHGNNDYSQASFPDRDLAQTMLTTFFDQLPILAAVKSVQDYRYLRVNRAGGALFGMNPNWMIGKSDHDLFSPQQAERFSQADAKAMKGEKIMISSREMVETPQFGRRIWQMKRMPIRAADGSSDFLLVLAEDLTEAVEAEEMKMHAVCEEANQRAAYLTEASAILGSSLDYKQNLQKLAEITVPKWADWCIISQLGAEGDFERIAGAHRREEKVSILKKLGELFGDGEFIRAVAGFLPRGGESYLSSEMDQNALRQGAKNEEHFQLICELGLQSVMIVPIIFRKEVRGSIAFGSSQAGKSFLRSDLRMVEEVAQRAAAAFENASLYEEAQKAIASRNEFLSIASHELKTPLTALKLQLQLALRSLKRGAGSGDTSLFRSLELSTLQVGRLTVLIEDLLDVSRIEAGRLSFQFDRLNLKELILETVERFQEHIQAAGCDIHLTLQEDVAVNADRFRLEQVLLNLLSNAVKYSPGRPIRIFLESDSDIARIRVVDKGIGIPSDSLELVFERFERVSSVQNISGLGLGLYITREILKGHHGKIYVKSKVGEGSEFVVELPNASVFEHEAGSFDSTLLFH